MSHDRSRWRIEPGVRPDLAELPSSSTKGAPRSKKATQPVLDDLHTRLAGLQDRLWAEATRSMLVVLQAMDGGGKDGTVKHVFAGVNPMGIQASAFKAPSPEELAHDFLWRIHRRTPRLGEIGIFN